MAQLWYSPISINSGQVPSTQTDFPVLVSQIDNRFKTIGNGGHVNNSSGFDIRPYSDTGLTTALTYELERYNASTGEVIMWVKVASLSSSTTPIYLGYGDTSISTDGSSGSGTFSNNFVSVWHLKDGSTLSLSDSGPNNKTLTNVNSVSAGTGQIDGCESQLSASNQYLTNNAGNAPGTALTLSAWVKATSFPNAYNATIALTGGTKAAEILVKSTGKLTCFVSATTDKVYDGTGSNTLSTGTWYLLHMTYDSTNGLIGYVNAGSDGTATANGNASTSPSVVGIGEDIQTAGRRWNGSLDEVRTASVARSANWITTEYNNQNAPGTFETLGTEVAIAANTGNFFLLFP